LPNSLTQLLWYIALAVVGFIIGRRLVDYMKKKK